MNHPYWILANGLLKCFSFRYKLGVFLFFGFFFAVCVGLFVCLVFVFGCCWLSMSLVGLGKRTAGWAPLVSCGCHGTGENESGGRTLGSWRSQRREKQRRVIVPTLSVPASPGHGFCLDVCLRFRESRCREREVPHGLPCAASPLLTEAWVRPASLCGKESWPEVLLKIRCLMLLRVLPSFSSSWENCCTAALL